MAANPSGAPSAVSDMEAASQIDAILASDPDYAEDQPEEESKPPVEAQEEPEESEESDEEAEEEEDQPEGESIEIDPDEELFEVEITLEGGEKETKKYSLNQLKKERMLEADYRRKTEELSRQRKETDSKLRQGVETERKQYLEALNTLNQAVMKLTVPEAQNLDQLAEEDPAEFIRVQRKLAKNSEIVQAIQAEQARVQQQELEYFKSEVLPKEMQKVEDSIPNWGAETKKAIMETGLEYGFSEQELSEIWDSRAIKVLHDAYQWRKSSKEMTDKKAVATKKVVEKPKVVKGSSTVKDKGRGDSYKKLQKSGRMEDAANVIAGML